MEAKKQDETSGKPSPIEPTEFETSGSFGGELPPPNGHVNVTVNTDSVNIHGSHLAALERICAQSPEIASQIIRSTEETAKYDYRRYRVGAISAASIAVTILICCAAVIMIKGFWAGIAFFMACAAVSAIISAIFTGKSQTLDWTIGLIGGSQNKTNSDAPDEPTGTE